MKLLIRLSTVREDSNPEIPSGGAFFFIFLLAEKSSMAIKVISFDIDGTLMDFDYNRAFWDEAVPHIYSKKHKIALDEAKKIVFKEFRAVGQKDIRWYKPSFWFRKFGIGYYKAVIQDLKHHIRLYKDTIPSLKVLSKKYRLIVISANTREFIEIKLKAEGIKKFFSDSYSVIDKFKGAKSSKVFTI